MSVMDTICALLATNIGAGILATPYALYHMGIYFGSFFIILMALLAHLSNLKYIEIKELMPKRVDSAYEIGYILFGRFSIFIIGITLLMLTYGCLIIFYMMIGDSISLLIEDEITREKDDGSSKEMEDLSWFVQAVCHKNTIILFAGIIHLFIIFKDQLEEMKVVSYGFCFLVLAFVIIIYIELIMGNTALEGGESVDWNEAMRIKLDSELLTSLTIFIFAYSG